MKTKAGELDAARDLFLEALEVHDRTPGAEPRERKLVLYHLGVLWFRGGLSVDFAARCLEALGAIRVEQVQFEEAEPLYLRSLRLREAELGADHPHVAASLESLCILERDREDFAAAAGYCRRSFDIRRRSLGSTHATTLASSVRLSRMLRLAGQLEAAKRVLLSSVEAWAEESEASGTPAEVGGIVPVRIQLAWIAWLTGEYEEAEARYRELLEIDDELGLARSRRQTASLGRGLALWKLGRFEAAERILRSLHEEFVDVFGPEGQRTSWTIWGLAGVYRDRASSPREVDEAGKLYEQAVEICQRSLPSGNEYRKLVEEDYRRYLRLVEGGE